MVEWNGKPKKVQYFDELLLGIGWTDVWVDYQSEGKVLSLCI